MTPITWPKGIIVEPLERYTTRKWNEKVTREVFYYQIHNGRREIEKRRQVFIFFSAPVPPAQAERWLQALQADVLKALDDRRCTYFYPLRT